MRRPDVQGSLSPTRRPAPASPVPGTRCPSERGPPEVDAACGLFQSPAAGTRPRARPLKTTPARRLAASRSGIGSQPQAALGREAQVPRREEPPLGAPHPSTIGSNSVIQQTGALDTTPSLGLPALPPPGPRASPCPAVRGVPVFSNRGAKEGGGGTRGKVGGGESRGRGAAGEDHPARTRDDRVTAGEPQQAAQEHRLFQEEAAEQGKASSGDPAPLVLGRVLARGVTPACVSVTSQVITGASRVGWPGSAQGPFVWRCKTTWSRRRASPEWVPPGAPRSRPGFLWEGASWAGSPGPPHTLPRGLRGGERRPAPAPPCLPAVPTRGTRQSRSLEDVPGRSNGDVCVGGEGPRGHPGRKARSPWEAVLAKRGWRVMVSNRRRGIGRGPQKS